MYDLYSIAGTIHERSRAENVFLHSNARLAFMFFFFFLKTFLRRILSRLFFVVIIIDLRLFARIEYVRESPLKRYYYYYYA